MTLHRLLLTLCAVFVVAAAFVFEDEEEEKAAADGCVTPDGFRGDCVNLLACRGVECLSVSRSIRFYLRRR